MRTMQACLVGAATAAVLAVGALAATGGPKTMPTHADVSNGAVLGPSGGGETFVALVDDPFFIDLGAVFDGIA